MSGTYDYAKYLVPRTSMTQDWADFLNETLRSGVYQLIPPSYRLKVRKESMIRNRRGEALLIAA